MQESGAMSVNPLALVDSSTQDRVVIDPMFPGQPRPIHAPSLSPQSWRSPLHVNQLQLQLQQQQQQQQQLQLQQQQLQQQQLQMQLQHNPNIPTQQQLLHRSQMQQQFNNIPQQQLERAPSMEGMQEPVSQTAPLQLQMQQQQRLQQQHQLQQLQHLHRPQQQQMIPTLVQVQVSDPQLVSIPQQAAPQPGHLQVQQMPPPHPQPTFQPQSAPSQLLNRTLGMDSPEERESKALLKLMEFSEQLLLQPENESIQFWQRLVARFYGDGGRLRYILANPSSQETKTYELLAPSLPRYYLGNLEAGVNEMQMIFDKTIVHNGSIPLSAECPNLTLVSHYTNGSRVFATGTLKVTFTSDYKFDLLELKALDFREYIPRTLEDPSTSPAEVKLEGKKKSGSKRALASQKKITPQTIPESVVNEFGITAKAMRLLDISDIFSKMNELLQHSAHTKQGAAESLATYSQQLRERLTLIRTRQLSLQSQSNSPTMPGQYVPSASPRSMKRRTSTGYSPNDQGYMASPVPSPALAVAQAHVSIGMVTPVMAHTGAVHTGVSNGHPSPASGPGAGLGLSVAGSPMQVMSPSISSPTFMTTVSTGTSGNANKTSKRVRTTSATPTLASSNVATSAVGMNGTGRNRKSGARKDSAAKKKNGGVDDNVIEGSSPAAAGPHGDVTVSSTAGQSMASSPNHTLITKAKEAPESGSMTTKSNRQLGVVSGASNNSHFYVQSQSTVLAPGEGQFVGEDLSKGAGGAVLFSSSEIEQDPSLRIVRDDGDPQGQRSMHSFQGLMQMQQFQQQQNHFLAQQFQQQQQQQLQMQQQLQQQLGQQQQRLQHPQPQQQHLGPVGGVPSEGGVDVPSMVPTASLPNAALLGTMDFGHASSR